MPKTSNGVNKNLIEELKQKLEKEKATLEMELQNFAVKDDKVKDNWEAKYPSKERGDQEEEADESQEYGNLLSLEHSLELKLKDVNSALKKISTDKYGVCEKCDKEIEEKRLLAYPEAKACMECNKPR